MAINKRWERLLVQVTHRYGSFAHSLAALPSFVCVCVCADGCQREGRGYMGLLRHCGLVIQDSLLSIHGFNVSSLSLSGVISPRVVLSRISEEGVVSSPATTRGHLKEDLQTGKVPGAR